MDLAAFVGTRCLAQNAAAGLIGRERCEMIIGRPARELAPFDGLKLAARELQRLFGRCGAGRETHDRLDEACDHATPKALTPKHLREARISPHASKCAACGYGSGAPLV